MIDSKKHLKKFGKVLETEIDAANPEITNVKATDISPIFPESFKLYGHQLKAIEAIKSGKNILISAGTNSGKTEAAFLSFVESLQKGTPCQVLFVYPNKALAADQSLRLEKYCKPYRLGVCVFDADNTNRFTEIHHCEIVLTNPAMLLEQLKHIGSAFGKSFKKLRYVILDEVHFYTAYQINLLLAMMKFVQESIQSDFQLILLSATVGNPSEIKQTLEELFNRESAVIAGRARHPPTKVYFLSSISSQHLYSSYLPENEIAVQLTEKYANDDASTLVFNDTRKDAAMIGDKAYQKVGDRVAMHYGSMDKEERSKNEEDFREGKIPVMVTVKTLQQGIDIGSVQRIVHVGLPTRQTDFWQRQGRMGRREKIEFCESIVLPAPRVAFDMFVVSKKERFEDFLTKKIEKVLLKHDSKIIKMFLGCMKLKYNMKLTQSEIDFLKMTRLIEPATTLARYMGNPASEKDFSLSRTGERFLSNLPFYTGESVEVFDAKGKKMKIGNTSLVNLQPHCIIFNNDIHHPRFFIVKELDAAKMEAILEPTDEVFYENMHEKIRNWKMFSQTDIDFSMTNPDSTFGNIILKPIKVEHVEYVVRTIGGRKRRVLKVLDEFDDVQGQEEFLSNYVLSDLPISFLKSLKKDLTDPLLIWLVIDAAFSCIRNGLRSKLDIAYDEFSHIISLSENGISSSFIFYETSCSDIIKDINWVLVSEGAKEFLRFVQESDEAGLFYLRGSHSYFKMLDELKKDAKREAYEWIGKTVDALIRLITDKLELVRKVSEDEKHCKSIKDEHAYADNCEKALNELLKQYPELRSIYEKLVVFLVDDYIESGYKLLNLTIAAARSLKIEERYVMFISIPAAKELSDSAVLTVILHELKHLQNLREGRPFENQIEEEASVYDAVANDAKKSNKIKQGLDELNKYLEKIQLIKHMYPVNELLTVGGTILENLRWQKVHKVKYIHWFRVGGTYRYHEIK